MKSNEEDEKEHALLTVRQMKKAILTISILSVLIVCCEFGETWFFLFVVDKNIL
jgi:hypothetical protein